MSFGITLTKRGMVWGSWVGGGLGSLVALLVGFSGSADVTELIPIPVACAIFLALCGGAIGVTIALVALVWAGILNFVFWLITFPGQNDSSPGNVSSSNDQDVQGESVSPPNRSPILRGRMRIAYCIADLPEKPGLYRHIDKENNRINYIGISVNIKRRNRQHESKEKLNLSTQKIAYAVAHPDASQADLRSAEKRHIKKHNPSGNRNCGGGGRNAR